jgi:hypothetical protein
VTPAPTRDAPGARSLRAQRAATPAPTPSARSAPPPARSSCIPRATRSLPQRRLLTAPSRSAARSLLQRRLLTAPSRVPAAAPAPLTHYTTVHL